MHSSRALMGRRHIRWPLVLCGAALALSACAGPEEHVMSGPPGSAEYLLTTEGRYQLVEAQPSQDPQQAHLATRNLVSPDPNVDSRAYTRPADQVKLADNTHFRLLQLKRHKDEPDLSAPPVQQFAAAPPPAPQPVLAAAPAISQAKDVQVTDVRVGQYPDRTRFVLDLSQAGKFNYNLDNQQGLLLVELDGAQWAAAPEETYAHDKMLKAYTTQTSQEGNAVLAVKLNGPAKLLMNAALPANQVYGNRIVFDVAPL